MASGFQQTLEWAVGAGAYAAFDRYTGDRPGWSGGEWEEAFGGGGSVVEWLTMVEPEGSADTTLQTGALLAYVKPATVGALPTALNIQGGVVATAGGAVRHTDAYITSCEMSLEHNGVVSVNYGWKALTPSWATIATAATPIDTLPFPWHGSNVLIEDAAYMVGQWSLTQENEITLHSDLDEKVAGAARFPVWAEPGPYRANLTATLRAPFDPDELDPLADCGATFGAVMTVTDCGGEAARILTVTLVDFKLDNVTSSIVEGGELVEYEVTAHATPNDLTAVDIDISPVGV